MQKEHSPFVVYGRQAVMEALKSSYSIQQLWLANDLQGKIVNQIKNLAENRNVDIKVVPKNEIQKISGPVVHQGVAAVLEPLKVGLQSDLDTFIKKEKNHFILLLDQIQDPHNLGAIFRTAEICGVQAVIIPEKGSAQLNDTVAKTSAGALFHLNIFRVDNLETCFETFADFKITSLALMPGADRPMYQMDLKQSVALVVGSEGQGVRKNIRRLCSDRISIPQFGKVDSLNASVATAVVLYEVVRQRSLP